MRIAPPRFVLMVAAVVAAIGLTAATANSAGLLGAKQPKGGHSMLLGRLLPTVVVPCPIPEGLSRDPLAPSNHCHRTCRTWCGHDAGVGGGSRAGQDHAHARAHAHLGWGDHAAALRAERQAGAGE